MYGLLKMGWLLPRDKLLLILNLLIYFTKHVLSLATCLIAAWPGLDFGTFGHWMKSNAFSFFQKMAQVQTRHNHSMEMGSVHRVHSLTKNLFAIDTCWDKKKSIFSSKVYLSTGYIYQTHPSSGSMSRVNWQSKRQYSVFLLWFSVTWYIFFLFSFLFFILFLFFPIFENGEIEKNMKFSG